MKTFNIISLSVQFTLFILSFYLCSALDVFNCEPHFIANIFMDLMGMFVCVTMFFFSSMGKHHGIADNLFLRSVAMETIILFTCISAWLIQGKPQFAAINEIINTLYFLCFMIEALYLWFTQLDVMNIPYRKANALTIIFMGIGVAYTILLAANISEDYLFSVDSLTGTYRRGPFFIYTMLPIFLMFFMALFYTLNRKTNWQIILSFLIRSLVPCIASICQYFTFGISFTENAMLFSLVVFHMTVQIDLDHKLFRAKTHLMLSQIKPHFLFNTLTSISALCETEPKAAQDTVIRLSKYLRGNMAIMETTSLISFEQEKQHVDLYTSIEKLRFPNIEILYDLQDINFSVPPLTIQPLVENAIRHGVRAKEKGVIQLKTFLQNNFHVIKITDNGIGFDLKKYKETKRNAKAGEHIGLRNVERRLLNMCNGTLEFDSEAGKGTTVTIKIPV